MSAKPTEDIVNVPVPVGALPLVHEVLNRYYRSLSTPPVERVPIPGNGEWSRADIAALHAQLRNPAMRAIMRCIAERADKPVSYKELADVAQLSFSQLRAQLAWLSKYAVTVKGENVWPMKLTSNSNLPPGQRYQYSMHKGIAQWWIEIDEESKKEDSHESV
jgi:hypothetical protein